ncbi:MAG: 1-acyl-sn-glycerol-3-phosphate acyltransferase [Flavobacteriaceae bacterium]|nr:1-acyl-sn-glycerol-3-phosphate acyltransferase [Flavobacteriaceae bacterium]
MKKLIGSLIYALMGWKLENNDKLTNEVHSCVLVCGPHTSNWDFVVTVAAFWKLGIPMKVFIKDAWTKPWYGFVIKSLGGIGVDRSARQNLTAYAAELLRNKTERLYLVNTPEGTRSFAKRWKKGFYYIAKEGEVPILFAFADYKKKKAGITGYIDPAIYSFEEVLDYAEKFYADVTPKFPEKFNKNFR